MFKLVLYVYKMSSFLIVMYLSNCLSVYVPRRNLRSSKDHLRLKYPRTRVLVGDWTFTVCASKEWNMLHVSIRKST